jgi:predicted nucleotidyltransferase
MRLNASQIITIENTAKAVLGEAAKVWLYGSRLNDQGAGGDIDLLIESPLRGSLMDRARIKYMIESALQLPVDVMTVQTGQSPSPFEVIARAKAVPLTRAQERAA